MVLDTPGTQFGARDALYRAVVEVSVGKVYAGGQGLFADGEAVVLAGDLDPPRVQIPYRMVRPMVAEGHLVRLALQGETQELVSEADAEGRNLAEQRAERVHGVFQSRWIPGPVRQEQAIGLRREYLLRTRRAGHREDRGAPAPELLVDGALHAVVEGGDAAALFAEGRDQGRFGDLGAGRGQVEADHRRVGVGFVAQYARVAFDRRDHAAHRALVPEVAGQGAGVESFDAQNAALLEEVGQRSFARPVAVVRGVLAYQYGGSLDPAGLLVTGDHTVVPDERVGEERNLAIAGEAMSLEDGPVFENHLRPRTNSVSQTALLCDRAPTRHQL